jgi:zinc transport system ATP-binding protein
MRMTTPVIDLHGASFGYADGAVVHAIDLRVDPGEVVAIVGPNGSGKSTLVRGLLGLTAHLGGEARIFGTLLAEFEDQTRLGYVPQRHSLSASIRATAREIVAIGRLPLRPWWRRPSPGDRRIVEDSLRLVGLVDRSDTEVSTLSGGQQRRVLIARALAGNPEALVMDEPTAGVDQANQVALADVLAALAARGVTLLIVTHELEALEDVITRVVCVRDGHVCFDGTPMAWAVHETAHAHGHGHHHDSADPQLGPAGTGTYPAPLDPTWREADRV